jgi:hypothetical protein
MVNVYVEGRVVTRFKYNPGLDLKMLRKSISHIDNNDKLDNVIRTENAKLLLKAEFSILELIIL